MNKENVKTLIEAGKAVVGIELGSTRIKVVMIDENHQPVASGFVMRCTAARHRKMTLIRE